MKKNGLFSNRQYGFLSDRSTTLQLLYVLEIWIQILENGRSLDAIYFDSMKAFDTIPHKRLIGKLESYGISEDLIEWVKSFLTDRRQRVRVNGSCSDFQQVTSGIPQGSVLRPILFVIYINNLPDKLESDCYMFADDTKIFRQIASTSDNEILQSDVKKLEDWSDTWLLRFHPDKCKVVTAGKSEQQNCDYILRNTTLQHVEKEKDIQLEAPRSL